MEVQEIDLGNGAKGVDWHPFAEPLKADPQVAPHLEGISEKDVGSLVKGYALLRHRMGSAINLPDKDTKPEEVKALKDRLYQAGLFVQPPNKPEEYELKAPESLPKGVKWSEEWSKKAAERFHKAGVTKDQAKDMLALHSEIVGEMASVRLMDYETGMTNLKTKWGGEFDQKNELASRAALGLYEKVPGAKEFFDKTGLGNDPAFIEIMYEIGMGKESDTGFMRASATETQEIDKKIATIMGDKKHPYWDRSHAGHEIAVNEMHKMMQGRFPGTVTP